MHTGSLCRAAPSTRLALLALAVMTLLVPASGLAQPAGVSSPRAPLSVDLIEPGICFTQEALEAELVRLLPSLEIWPGATGEGGSAVLLRRRPSAIDVEVRRAPRSGPARSEHHNVPLGNSECRVLLETVASIVARAVTPIGVRPAPAPPSPPPPPPPPLRVVLPPVLVRGHRPPPALQLEVALRLSLSPDGVDPGAAGLFTVAWRRSNVVVFVGAGVEQPLFVERPTSSAFLVRFPVLLGLGYEFEIPSGAIRVAAAALMDLWHVTFKDPLGRLDSVWVHGGLFVSLTYHYRPVRLVDVFLGVDFDRSFQSNRWIASDRSLGLDSPSNWFNPKLGLSLNFF